MAGRRMPHNNRMSSSSALRTNDIWSKTIGHNPYKNEDDDDADEAQADQAAGLMLLAKMTNVSGSETRGGCSKCGMMGHLRYQCRNTIQLAKPTADDDSSSSSSSDEEEEKKPELRPSENWGTKLDVPKEDERELRRGAESSRDRRKSHDDRSRSRSRDRDDDRRKSKKHKKEHKEKKDKEKKRKSKDEKKSKKNKK